MKWVLKIKLIFVDKVSENINIVIVSLSQISGKKSLISNQSQKFDRTEKIIHKENTKKKSKSEFDIKNSQM